MITSIQALVLGIVQGLTEFLPVSSSAHLVLVPWFLGWKMPANMMAFDVALHIGTLIAMAVFFFFDYLLIVASYIGDVRMGRYRGGQQGSMLPKIVLACIPAAIVGKLFEHKIEAFFYDNPANYWWLAVTMSLFGLALLLAEKAGKQQREVNEVTYQYALIIGLFQCLALVPGTSRSGITIVAALLLGFTRPAAARFSFLVALPITAGAVLLKAKDMHLDGESMTPLLVGIAASAVVGIIAIKGLLRYVQHRSYAVFAVYRWVIAACIVGFYFARTRA